MIMDSRRLMASRGELACNVPHRAVAARIHGLQQFECLRSAHLADDDALGPHAQTVFDAISHGDLALEIGGPRFHPYHVRLRQLQFRRTLAGYDAFVVIDRAGETVKQLANLLGRRFVVDSHNRAGSCQSAEL
jgi:hypothetical protein